MKIESSDTSIEGLLDSNYFVIPQFQRPYSWDNENLEDFWQDVVQSGDDEYFIGSMVVYNSGRQQFGVVDGQQRLTTITIILCALRDCLLELGSDDLARGLHQLVERVDRNNKSRFVLKTETSFPYFQEEVQKIGAPDVSVEPQREEERIQAAYNLYRNKIDNLLESISIDPQISDDDKLEVKADRLVKLRDSILFLKLILIELDNEDDAFVIFETLNTRGKDLSLSDLLKNHFSKCIKSKGDVDVAKELWSKVLSSIFDSEADIDPDTFFTHSWSSRFESTTQQKAFKRIKSAVKPSNAKKHLDDFVEDGQFYRSIFEPTWSWDKSEKKISASLEAYRLFRISQHTPAVLSLVRAYRKQLIKNGKLTKTLKTIENFHFQFTAVTSSRSSGGISHMYSSFGRKLFEATSANEAGAIIGDLEEKLREKLPTPSEFSASFDEIRYTSKNSKQSALMKYILINFAKHEGLGIPDDFADLSIEHIHPQSKLSADWDEANIGQVGNLILLTHAQNQEVGNKAFKAKLPFFQSFGNSVPKYVLEQTSWTTDNVRWRTTAMAETAQQEIWPV